MRDRKKVKADSYLARKIPSNPPIFFYLRRKKFFFLSTSVFPLSYRYAWVSILSQK